MPSVLGHPDIELTNRLFGRVQLRRNNQFCNFLLKVCELIYRTDADQRRFLGLVAEVGLLAGGMNYGAAAQAVRRFAAALA